ncbi:hypothetical protein [Mucilaginibacter xinganensis]|uniref:CarboxypepD_reg-like domain-containing protein n=1 Tax=Mucilaginibacter xinganensis TaxID=1234841 RepID=A0A223P3G7_9SPHI|nr:hypothetical protein [Mucilaginibacter xinganensis]ASU36514.1 hypothetical protein MuYL_4631 [Mucilaginibacter xinganensis]
MRYKFVTITMLCFGLWLQASAQQTFVVKGVISRSVSTERIAQVLITNLRSRDIKMSDELGWFSVDAAIGDTLLFSKLNYTDQKVIITAKADIPVYMQPVIQLDQVTIKGQTKRQELNEIMSDYRKQGIYYNGKPPVTSFLTSPLTGLYELFGKGPGNARRFANFSKGELEYAELRRRYNVALVMRVTNTTDTVAKKFMEYYTPSFEDLKGWNDYELIRQIRKSYDFYDKSENKTKLEQLNQPTFIKPKQDQP